MLFSNVLSAWWLRLAFWLTSLGCRCRHAVHFRLPTGPKLPKPRFSILSALESFSYGALWLLPFYTEVRFALVASASAMQLSVGQWAMGMAGECIELAITGPSLRCICSSSRGAKPWPFCADICLRESTCMCRMATIGNKHCVLQKKCVLQGFQGQ